jgi:hypothetical protein
MRCLFDSNGRHIANLVEDQLFTAAGIHAGHWLEHREIFIDVDGRYLGELFHEDRLLYDERSRDRDAVYGDHGDGRDAAGTGSLEGRSRILMPSGCADIVSGRLATSSVGIPRGDAGDQSSGGWDDETS